MVGIDYLKLQNQGSIISNIRLLHEMSVSDGYADSKGYFTKAAVAEIGVNSLIITSGSKVGDEAKAIISKGGDESRNSPLQNAKARMQILRVLGLVSADYGSEVYAITRLGSLLIAQVVSETPDYRLLRELFMNITTATEIYEHNCSLGFNCYLGYGICYALSMLDYRLSSKEMPMLTTYDIKDIDEFVAEAEDNRMSGSFFTPDHPHFPKTQKGIPLKQVSNLTRSINQILRVCGILEPRQKRVGNENYYVCTPEGRSYVDAIRKRFPKLRFITASDFRKKNNITWQKSLCVSSYDALLYRSGIDASKSDSYNVFSPYQIIPETSVEWFIDGNIRRNPDNEQSKINLINSLTQANELRLSVMYDTCYSSVMVSNRFAEEITSALHSGLEVNEIVDDLYKRYESADKEVFYPVVHSLLNLIGLDCKGEVGRYDAYCSYRKHVIPVEIKSNTEVHAYNLKGIRQAIENKISTYNAELDDDLSYASLVIGYDHPANDSETRLLIEQAHAGYGINILTCDMRTLTKMAVNSIVNHILPDWEHLLKRHGYLID